MRLEPLFIIVAVECYGNVRPSPGRRTMHSLFVKKISMVKKNKNKKKNIVVQVQQGHMMISDFELTWILGRNFV